MHLKYRTSLFAQVFFNLFFEFFLLDHQPQNFSVNFLQVLAKKQEKICESGLNIKRKPFNKKEQLQFIVEGFPGIGPKTAKKLLENFKTIQNIINAPKEQLEKLIGKKADIFKLKDEKY